MENTQNSGMVSPDGRWRWDGTQWIPQEPSKRMPGQSLPTPVLMALVGLTVVVVFGIIAVIFADSENTKDEQQFNDVYCQSRWADPGDPRCS